jgi:hypothetical protein
MMPGASETPPWSRRRWGYTLALLFAVQVACIFWMGERGPGRVRTPRSAPTLCLAGQASAEWFSLIDPTLLALPHRQGFSGPAWLEIPAPPQHLFEWSEEPHWLDLGQAQLATAFGTFVNSQPAPTLQLPTAIQPELTLPDPPLLSLAPTQSVLWVEGPLAQRRMVSSATTLPDWPAADLLSNSLVRVVVGADGWPVSAWLRGGGCGLKAADDAALAVARSLRFEPTLTDGPRQDASQNPAAGLTWGCLVFQWRTLPLSGTNAPGGG